MDVLLNDQHLVPVLLTTMSWSRIHASPADKESFFGLLDDYFQYRSGQPSPSSPPASLGHLSNRLAQAALSTSSNKFVSRNSAALAPHAVSAVRASFASPTPPAAAPAAAAPPPPTSRIKPRGPAGPASGGLTSGKSIGKYSTSSGAAFGKSFVAAKNPLTKDAREAAKAPVPIATRSPPPGQAYGAVAAPVEQEYEVVRAAYDYAGGDADDLRVSEGDTLWIIERVSDDWSKCRNERGEEGLVPASYLTT